MSDQSGHTQVNANHEAFSPAAVSWANIERFLYGYTAMQYI